MVSSRTDTRLDELEKTTGELHQTSLSLDAAVKELNAQFRHSEEQMAAMLHEMREGFASLKLKETTNLDDGSTSANHASKVSSAGGSSGSPMPTFDGSEALAWLARAEQYFLIAGTAPEDRVGLAMVALAGPALPWYQLLRLRVPDLSWARFARELMKRFGGTGALNEYEAFAAVRHTGSLAEFVAAFEARLAQVPDISSQQYLGFFMAALRPEVRLQMKAAKITTYEDAVEMALDLDIMASTQPPRPAPSQPTAQTHTYQSHSNRSATKGYSPNPSYSTASSKPVSKRFRNVSPEEYRRHIAAGTCVKCGLKFGPAHRCPPKTLNVMICDEQEDATADSDSDEEEIMEPTAEPQLSVLSLNGLDTANTMKLFGEIASHPVKVMIDSGANYCFISEQCAQRLALPVKPTSPYSVVLGDGSTRQAAGMCKHVSLILENEEFVVSCYVFPLRNIDVILGVAWLASLGYVMANWQRSTMDFRVHGRPVSLKGDPSLMRRACSTRDLRGLEEGDCCWVLRAMEKGAAAEPFGLDSALSAAARSQILELIGEFPDTTRESTGLPPHRRTDHRIPLVPGTNPVSVRPYRYNHLQKDEMEKLVAEMLASGVIQPSTSPFSSPVLLVRKKDGSWRFCVDYRELNKRTVPDKYPIPVIQELLDELHGAKWFSKIDLKAGYHQIRVAAADIPKTAFRTHSGHYEFLVMPFGLTNAPATFQSLMNDIFRPALRKFVLVFFDDILVYSATWAEHMRHLRQVFEVLNTHSLVVNAKKCLLGRTSVEYLGHIVSFDGVRMDPAKVSAVLRWPTPTNLKCVRGFLGLTGYYRRFIRDYGKIAAPLTELLKKPPTPPSKPAWTWPEAAASAFEALKAALTSAPLLRMPDFSKEFVIECDASGRGLGAVLMQDRQPVAYFSKTLSARWLNKSAYEKELMGLVLAIQHWRPYLLGRRFVVYTDQRSLRQLLAHPLATPAQQNWAAKLLGYDFTIVYKEGRLNRAADALSRRDDDTMELAAISIPSWPEWSSVQSTITSDPTLARIKEALEAGQPSSPHYELIHGTLFYKGRIVVPPGSPWIPRLLAEFHVTPTGGHSGAYRTYRRIASNVYWPGMVKQVTNFVAACATCQRHKSETKSPAGLLQPLPIPDRIWEDISMDFVSGLPRAGGLDCIFVIVDRLSKYAHFIGLRHPFTARQVAEVFTHEVVRLHGIPRSIVSDRDPIFLSSFWRELFRATGTTLKMSSAYHPETDGQTEVLNRCLQTYLRCFSSDRPKQWNKWLGWAEYCYNTSTHSASGMTPFEAVYGRPPPTLHAFLPGEIRAQSVLDNLRSRDEILKLLRLHLERAQDRMTTAANKRRRDIEFSVGDMVYLKFRPHRQSSLFSGRNRKLAPRFFGPFRIEARIGTTAYRLRLPDSARIHPVFHVSLLKRAVGDAPVEATLPDNLVDAAPLFLPDKVLARRTERRDDVNVDQVLVSWVGLGDDEATWMDEADARGQFPFFSLVDKAVPTGGAIDTINDHGGWKVYTRRNRDSRTAEQPNSLQRLRRFEEVSSPVAIPLAISYFYVFCYLRSYFHAFS